MTQKVAMNLLVRTSSDRCQQTAAPKLRAAATLVALSALFAPAAYAHGSDEAPNPFCFIQGPGTAACGTNVTFVATAPSLAGQSFNATWSFLNNNAGATFVGPNFCLATQSCSVVVTTSQNGSVVVRVILDFGGGVLKTCQVTFTVAGGSPPTGTCPPDITVPCPGPIDPSVTGMPTFSGGCGSVTTSFVDTVTGSNCAGPITTRTWTATNTQGQTATCTQTISRSSVPLITCPAPMTVSCFSLVPLPDPASVVASDGCGGTATVTHVGDVASNGTSNCSNFISRTYRATNACGFTTDCTQTITVSDTTPPSITCPGPMTVQCFSLVPAPSTTAVTASDSCGGAVTVIHLGDAASAGTTSCNNVITRTYRATDACGNQGTCTQMITVNDTTAPMVNCPGPQAFQCFSQVPAPNIGSVSGSDNCGGLVTVTHVGDSASNGTSSCMNIVTRTYQGVDACGNVGTCIQTFTVSDTTPPSITCPGPVSIQCFSALPPPNIGSVTGTDNCGGAVTVTHMGDSASNGTSSVNNIVTRTYQAVDSCGNMNTCTQTITVNDTTGPMLTCAGALSVQCFSLVPPPNIASVTAIDGCAGAVTVTFMGDVASNGTSNCFNVITRTYQGVDLGGNVSVCTQTITVNDTTPPAMITCPAPVTVTCFSQVPPPAPPSIAATDNCGGVVAILHLSDTPSNGSSSCNNVITRTYRATDLCGNQATCTQMITVNDTTPPVLSCPAPLAVQCFSLLPAPNIGLVSGTDNCGGAVTITHLSDVAMSGTSNCMNVITRTYQGVDACGNAGTCAQMITVNDTTPPSITCPGPVAVQCFSLVPASNISLVTATDNCGGVPTITFLSDVATNGTSSCMNMITRTYMATDACGNMNTCTQMITVNDTTPPVLTCPIPSNVQCFSLVPAASPTAVTATDNCGGAVTVTLFSETTTNGTSNCFNVVTRTYQGLDSCGNMGICTQTIAVNDTTPPVITTCPAPVTATCFSLVPAPNIASVTASDNCTGAVTVTFVSDTPSNGTSSCNNVVTRTYRATDLCGNQATCTQLITVNDTTPPSITCPAPVSFQCFSQVPAPVPGLLAASDNCGGLVTVIHVGDSATNGTSSCNNVVTRTYQATDPCGNLNTCTQTITVNDNTIPIVTCPVGQAVQCFAQVPPPDPSTVSTLNGCGGTVTVVHVSDVPTNGTSNCANSITRTYQATDPCGFSNTCTQVFVVNDNTPPSITCPGPVSVQCFSLVPPATPLLIAASDNCGGVVPVIHVSDVATNGTSSCNNVITRIYLATDACGNTNTCTQMITVNDTTPPGVFCPPPQSAQCFALIPLPDPLVVATSDNCGGAVTVTFLSDVAANGTSSCANVITRTYQGTDACGNSSTCTQVFTVNDTTPPSLSCPTAVTVQCFSAVPLPSIASVTATDNCTGTVTVTHMGDSPTNGTSSCNNVITRTYQATDLCGNTNTCTQTITVNDTTIPTLTCPTAAAFQCFSQVPTPSIASVTATDNCTGAVTVTFVSDVPTNGTSSCMNMITRTYQGVDACGNVGLCSQVFTVNDTTLPTLTCPTALSFQCFSQVPTPSTTAVTATDNCGSAVTVTFLNDVATNGSSSCNNVITRTYQGMDLCGNVGTCTQTITVNDTTLPVLTCPAPAVFQCFSLVPAANPTAVTATDNCGGAVTVTFVSDVATNGTSSCMNMITRTYQGADACGNMSTCTQVFTVNDTMAPVLTCPAPAAFQCFAQVPTPNVALVTGTDNCGGAVTVTFLSDSASNGTSSCMNIVTRTYQGVDACGNVSTCLQTFTVNDTTPPVISCPIDFMGACGSPTVPSTTGMATATDNCNLAPTISFTDVVNGVCPTVTLVITRLWVANDGCNTASCTQTITLTPPPPVAPGCVFDLGGGCGNPTPTLTATFQAVTLTALVTGAAPNAVLVLAAEVPPYSAPTNLAGSCFLHLDGLLPPATSGMFQTDATGSWTGMVTVPAYPATTRTLLQALVETTSSGPIGLYSLTNGLDVWRPCPPCTYRRLDYAISSGPANALYQANWITVFSPLGMDIGIYNPANGTTPPNGIRWTPDVAGQTALKQFIAGVGGQPGNLILDAINANVSSSGALGRVVAVLRINVVFNTAGLLGETTPGFGNFIYTNPGSVDPLEGQTVNQILALADQILAGNTPPPAPYTFATFVVLVELLNEAFQGCVPSGWAGQHLLSP